MKSMKNGFPGRYRIRSRSPGIQLQLGRRIRWRQSARAHAVNLPFCRVLWRLAHVRRVGGRANVADDHRRRPQGLLRLIESAKVVPFDERPTTPPEMRFCGRPEAGHDIVVDCDLLLDR